MKGYVYYLKAEAERNRAFIDELTVEADKVGIDLTLLVDEEAPDTDAAFILFRDRNPLLAAKFEMEGLPLVNRAEVNRIANDKFKTFELATLLGIPAVPTKKLRSIEDIAAYPCVVKTVDGHGGEEVFLCSSEIEAKAVVDGFGDRGLIVQPYVETGAQDVRVFMLGDEVLGAVKRTGNGSFKSNYTLGGSVEKLALASWQENDAVTLAKALKSDYIGIDFLLLPDGSWLLNEIEDPVGARSFYVTHDFSVAAKVMGYIRQKLLS